MGSRFLPPLAAFLFLALAISLAPDSEASAQTTAPPAYLAIGDSLAFGVGADSPENDGYVALTAQYLRGISRFEKTGLDLENVSVPGAKAADLYDEPDGQMVKALTILNARGFDDIEGNEVRVVTISIGANDLLELAQPGRPCVENAGSKACRDELDKALNDVHDNLQQVLYDVGSFSPRPDIYVTDLYNPYSGSGDEFEIIASVGVQELNAAIRLAASIPDSNIHLVSVFPYFQGRSEQWIAQDGIHPNNDGYRVIAEVLQATIEGRPVAIPDDLLALPTDEPAVAIVERNGIRPVVFWIALPLVFAAGLALSAAYFLVRGRG